LNLQKTKKRKNKETKENVDTNVDEIPKDIKKVSEEVKKVSVNAFAMLMQSKGVGAKTASPNVKKRKRDN